MILSRYWRGSSVQLLSEVTPLPFLPSYAHILHHKLFPPDFPAVAAIISTADEFIAATALTILASIPYAAVITRPANPAMTFKWRPAAKAAVKVAAIILLAIPTIALLPAFFEAIRLLADTFVAFIIFIILIGAGGLIICALIWEVGRHGLWPNIHDWWRIQRMGPALPVNRKQIADNLSQFASSTGRAAYVRWLSGRVSDLDRNLRDPDDRWPGDIRPNYDDDDASAMLARLDERWLHLSR